MPKKIMENDIIFKYEILYSSMGDRTPIILKIKPAPKKKKINIITEIIVFPKYELSAYFLLMASFYTPILYAIKIVVPVQIAVMVEIIA